jgi:unsaturated rhamnogalacturonyl hydrolase
VTLPPDARTRLAAAADLLVRYPFEFWHYGDSIGFEGLLAATDVLDDSRYEGWLHGAVRAWAARAEPYRELDNTAPGHAMCLAFERTGDEAILGAARGLAGFLAGRRTIEGAFVSFERAPLREPWGGEPLSPSERGLLADPGAGVFVDCLHFDPPFFAHLAALTDETALADLAAEQALAHLSLLQDESGLVWHFYLEKTGERYGYGWARGQGWALLGLLDLIERLPQAHPSYPELRSALLRLADALAGLQLADGSWRTVASDPASPPETSTSAFAAAGFAKGVLLGLLDGSFEDRARRAWHDAWSNVDERGVLTGVSAAVWASTASSHYPNVPVGFVVPWGQGPLLLAARLIAELPG